MFRVRPCLKVSKILKTPTGPTLICARTNKNTFAVILLRKEQILLLALIPELGELTRHEDARVRSDACHYLSLTHDDSAKQYIVPLLDDEHDEVREVAEESLEVLNEAR